MSLFLLAFSADSFPIGFVVPKRARPIMGLPEELVV